MLSEYRGISKVYTLLGSHGFLITYSCKKSFKFEYWEVPKIPQENNFPDLQLVDRPCNILYEKTGYSLNTQIYDCYCCPTKGTNTHLSPSPSIFSMSWPVSSSASIGWGVLLKILIWNCEQCFHEILVGIFYPIVMILPVLLAGGREHIRRP